jgi:hypothetical protein
MALAVLSATPGLAQDPPADADMTALRRALREGDEERRVEAARTLSTLGPEAHEALPELRTALVDDAYVVRRAAGEALWAMGEVGVRALVADHAAASETDRDRIAGTLRRADAGGVAHLLDFYEDEDRDLGEAAARALVTIGWRVLVSLEARAREDGARGHEELAERILSEGFDRFLRIPEGQVLTGGPLPDAPIETLALEWEWGSGHGGTLAFCRIGWSGDRLLLERVAIVRARDFDLKEGRPGEADPVTTERRSLDTDLARAVLRTVLRATALRLEDAPEPPRTIGGWASSADFHAGLRVYSGDELVFDESYTGYAGSLHQAEYLRARVASLVLTQALREGTWEQRPATTQDLDVLALQMREIGQRTWWVRDRILKMVGALGDEQFEPALRSYIRSPLDDVPRGHLYAIDAYARITGVDFRGEVFSLETLPAVRARYLATFER